MYKAIAALLIPALLLAGCAISREIEPEEVPAREESREVQQEAERDAPETLEQPEPEPETKSLRPIPGEAENPAYTTGRDGGPMHLEKTFDIPVGENTATVEYHIDVAVVDGEYYWDDGQEITLLVRMGDRVYPLIANAYTGGGLELYVKQDYEEGETTLLVLWFTRYSLDLYEYHYDQEQDRFLEDHGYQVGGNIDLFRQ